jgi:hypothetical protein
LSPISFLTPVGHPSSNFTRIAAREIPSQKS